MKSFLSTSSENPDLNMQLFDHLTIVNLSYFDSDTFETSLEDPKLLFIGPLSGKIDAEIQMI